MLKVFILLFLVMALNFSPAISEQPKVYEDVATLAKEFVSCLSMEDYKDAVEYFDKGMKLSMPAKSLEEIWKTTTIQLGPFKSQKHTEVEKSKENNYDIVYVTCEFERITMDIRLIFNEKKKICAMSFVSRKH